jgi:hypothetical protein
MPSMAVSSGRVTSKESERIAMSEDREVDEEGPCLHCLIVELIDDFFAEYRVATGEPNQSMMTW